jgi:serine protease Do/serine protease DegQ
MTAKITPGLLTFLLAFGVNSFAANETEPSTTTKTPPAAKPTLSVDNSYVSTAGAPPLASYADVIEPAQKAVVSVYSTKIIRERALSNPFFRPFPGDQIPERESKEQGLGSGVIVSANGFVLTNNHVIEGADELSVALPDGREFKAKVIGTDPKTDIAVVKIDSDNLPTLVLADSDKLRVGDVVFAIGNPLGIGQTVTMGIVSAKGRNSLGLIDGGQGYESFIQTDAAINMGNSGGALIDAKGRLIGINSAIVSTTRGNIGIGLAIPVNLAASIMTSLTESGSVIRGYLGVSVDPVGPEVAETLGLKKDTKAVVVTVVSLDGPAEKAGLKRSDAIISIEDKPVTSVQDLRLLISQMPPDTEIAIKIVRDGKEKNLKAKLGRLSNDTAPNKFIPGVEVMRLSGELRHHLGITDRIDGLVITDVEHNSPYFDRLIPDMVIMEINRRPVTDIDTARQLLQPGRNLLFIYNRGVYRYLVVVTDLR